MRLLLIGNIAEKRNTLLNIPTNLCLIKSILRLHGHECDIVDYLAAPYIPDACYDYIIFSYLKDPDYVTNAALLNSIAGKLHDRAPLIIGPCNEEGLEKSLFSSVVGSIGGLLRVLGDRLELEEPPHIKDINNSIFSLVPDLSGLELSAYSHSISEIDRQGYIGPGCTKYFTVMPLTFVWGCKNSCAFCPNTGKLSYLPAKSVANIIRELKSQGVSNYLFLNNLLNFDEIYLNEFLSEIKCLDIRWSDCMRPQGLDLGTLKVIRKSGCVRLSFGVETGSEDMRFKFGKKITNEEIFTTLRLSHEAGIWNHCSFIFGFPHETTKDVELTLEFIKDNIDFIDQLSINPFWLYERSGMFRNPEKYGIKAKKQKGNICGLSTVIFDEVNALSGYAKHRQIKRLRAQITNRMGEFYRQKSQLRYTDQIDMHTLLLLDEIFGSKKEALQQLGRNINK